MANTVKIKKYLDIIEEIEASGTITPGMLLELDSDGKVRAHSGEGEDVLPMFALEDELQGKTINDNYTSGQPVQVWIPVRGEQVLAELADDENVSIGDFLCSDGNGRLKKYEAISSTAGLTVYQEVIVGQALEAVDLSTSTGAWGDSGQKIKIRVI